MIKRALILLSFLGFSCSVFSQSVINLKKKGGVFVVPCTVNGLKLEFIFDTGAADVSISLTEALFMLKNGYLSKKDIVGSANYQNASGDIEEGVIINLKEIEFGGIKLSNIRASIVTNLDAPLLLGQSAISKLGIVQIDFNSNTLTVFKDGKNAFTSNKFVEPSTIVKDVDGNSYQSVKISNQIWSAENLSVSKYSNGEKIPQANSNYEWESYSKQNIGCWSYYKFDSSLKKYGKLYSWYAVSDKRGLAPKGWHIPSDWEWVNMINLFGGIETAGQALKNSNEWDENYSSINKGFEALPAGAFSSPQDGFIGIKEMCFWWTSTSSNEELAWSRSISKGFNNIERSELEKFSGLSIRIVKD